MNRELNRSSISKRQLDFLERKLCIITMCFYEIKNQIHLFIWMKEKEVSLREFSYFCFIFFFHIYSFWKRINFLSAQIVFHLYENYFYLFSIFNSNYFFSFVRLNENTIIKEKNAQNGIGINLFA